MNHRSKCVRAPLFLFLSLLVYAQNFASLTGVVKDSTGAILPGALLIVTDENTGIRLSIASQSDGGYRAPQLTPGTYSISAEVAGFKKLTLRGLKLDVGTTLSQDLTLELGAITESVTVTSQQNLVESSSGEVGTTVSISHVQEMALADRNVYRLVNLAPGAFVSTASGQAAGTPVFVGGSRGWSVANSVDGVNNTRGGLGIGNVEMSPPVDSMQEFKVQLSSYSAQSGRSSNGQITAVTRSGSNRFHGSLYEYLRNDKFDAAGWGNDSKPALRRNNFGGTLGGPIIRNRTFFFFNYDGLRQQQGTSVTRNVGLPEWKSGDFSKATRQQGNAAAAQPVYDPATGTGTFAAPINNTPFASNIIPSSRLDPVALKAVQFIPGPNRTPDNPFTQAGNWQRPNVNRNTRSFYIGRVDQEWTTRTKMFFRYIIAAPDKTETPALEGWGDADPSQQSVPDRHQNASLNLNHLFSPTFFVSATIGFNRTRPANISGAPGKVDYAKLLGLPNAPPFGFAQLAYAGGAVPVSALGFQRAERFAAFTNTDYMVNFTKVRNNHTFLFGAQYTRYNGNVRVQPSAGTYSFSGRFTQGYSATGAAIANTGINFADFLLGRMNSVAAESIPSIGKRIQYYGGYVQDDWRITPRLILNTGLRYETETPAYGINDYFSFFDPWTVNPLAGTGDIPAGARGITRFQNRNGEGKYLYNWRKLNFAPRFGFAYRLTASGDTVVRGGFGIYFGNPITAATVESGNAPFGQTYSLTHPIPFSLRDGLPATWLALPTAADFVPTWGTRGTKFAQSSASSLDPNRPSNYSQNFNLTLQKQWKKISFEAGYLGNLSRHVPSSGININVIPPALLSQTSIPERFRRPYTVLTGDQSGVALGNATYGISNYHAFTFKSERRFSNGVAWLIAYTRTKWIDNVNFPGGGNPSNSNDQIQNIYNIRAERSLSTGSFPHRLVLSPIVQLPFGKGMRWLSGNSILNALAGGWEVSTISTMQSGGPFGVNVLNGGILYLGDSSPGQVLRPDLIGNPNLSSGQGSPAAGVRGIQWFNTSAFAVPARYTFGNAARTLPGIFAPGLINFDSLLAKTFTIREIVRAQFRWEVLNTSNTPSWNVPASQLGAGTFGVVTSAGGRRIMQFGLKLSF